VSLSGSRCEHQSRIPGYAPSRFSL
jgi:hypothetical protein